MQVKDLKLGVVYWIAGQGPMKIRELPDPPRKTTVTLHSPDGPNYYASLEQILHPAKPKVMDYYVEQVRSRLTVSDELLKWQQELKA